LTTGVTLFDLTPEFQILVLLVFNKHFNVFEKFVLNLTDI